MTQSQHDAREQARNVAAKRATSRRDREERRRRLVLMTTGITVVVAVLSLLSGVLYDRVYIPNQMVATVGDQTLTRASMISERRLMIASMMAQNILLANFGGTFAERFQQQNPYLEAEIDALTVKSEIDGETVANWVDSELLAQAANSEYGVTLDEDLVNRAILNDYASVFLKEETAPEPTVSADAGDAASAPTATAAPPTATPDAPTAVTQFNKIIDALFLAYTNGLTAQGLTPKLNKEDFSVALRKQYSRQVLTNGVKEKLVPAESFTASDQPTGYETSQIFVRVDVPEGTADAERDALFAAKRAEADALLQRVQSGEDFAEVAASASDYATNLQHNGKMDVFDATGKSVAGTQFEQSYVDATLSLQVGEVYAEPVRTTFGWHIIKLDTVRLPSFDEQLATARGDAFEEWFAALSDKLAVGYAVAPTATVIPEATQAAPLLPTAALGGYPTDVPASEPPPATPTTTPTPKP
jgi:hypothetical protein